MDTSFRRLGAPTPISLNDGLSNNNNNNNNNNNSEVVYGCAENIFYGFFADLGGKINNFSLENK